MWLEMRLNPQEMRKTMMDYLGLNLDPKKGMTVTMDTLDRGAINQISEKIKNWTILTDPQKQAALSVLFQQNSTLGDLADAIVTSRQF